MRRNGKDGESKAEWLKKVRKAPCSKFTREWFGCDDEETNIKDNDAQESELGHSVFIIDPKGDEYLAESHNDNGVKFQSNGHTFWLGESGSGMAFAKDLIICSRVACSVTNDVQQP